MIEFFLSKFWAVVCGMVILGAAMVSISGLETATDVRSTELTFDRIVSDISSFAELDGDTTVILSLNGLLDGSSTTIEIMRGGIIFKDDRQSISATIPGSIILLDTLGQEISQDRSLVACKGQCIVLKKNSQDKFCALTVQDEKVSTTFLTEPTNMSQSFSSL